MAVIASILSPDKKVLLPNPDAGCLMGDMISAMRLRAKLDVLPPMPVVTYVNSSAEVKALSTICCTSANVVEVVNSLEGNEVLLVPDRNLAMYAASKTDKKIHFWDGFCPIHEFLTPEEIVRVKAEHPHAVFLAHPECRPQVLQMADFVDSTSGMRHYIEKAKANEFIIGTEMGIIHPIQKVATGKKLYSASSRMTCKDMKKISLRDVLNSLEELSGEVKVPEEVRLPALKSIQAMIDLNPVVAQKR